MSTSSTKQFVFKFGGAEGKEKQLKVDVAIPLPQSTADFAGRLINAHNIPCYVEPDLLESLNKFVLSETKAHEDALAEAAIEAVRNGEKDVSDLVNSWTRQYTQGVAEFAPKEALTNELVFSEVYHSLIHSAALETLLNLEHTYALSVGEVIAQRDRDMEHLEHRQSKDMEDAVSNLGSGVTTENINQLAQRHFENTELISSKWASELSNLQETQRREYREWVMKVHEDTQTTAGTPTYVQRVRALSNPGGDSTDAADIVHQPVTLEESFTINLGAQLKTMHNLRLLSMDVLDLARHKPNRIGGMVVPQPQRLQTAMSLYSNSLCGLVLMVDNRLNSYSGIKRDFACVCEQSTDFHFPELAAQFERIEMEVVKGNEWRTSHQRNEGDGDQSSIHSGGSSSSEREQEKLTRMQTGDFYITRHSNLAEAHVVFHLVADDTIRASDVSSRHPVILGYRNILKACFRYDIYTITLPLLLVHEMTEEMTIPWCLRRAELVFKCVKGFMMELATWGGQESRTINFLVPKGLSEETFHSLSNMLPSIFRMSNPVIAKS